MHLALSFEPFASTVDDSYFVSMVIPLLENGDELVRFEGQQGLHHRSLWVRT